MKWARYIWQSEESLQHSLQHLIIDYWINSNKNIHINTNSLTNYLSSLKHHPSTKGEELSNFSNYNSQSDVVFSSINNPDESINFQGQSAPSFRSKLRVMDTPPEYHETVSQYQDQAEVPSLTGEINCPSNYERQSGVTMSSSYKISVTTASNAMHMLTKSLVLSSNSQEDAICSSTKILDNRSSYSTENDALPSLSGNRSSPQVYHANNISPSSQKGSKKEDSSPKKTLFDHCMNLHSFESSSSNNVNVSDSLCITSKLSNGVSSTDKTVAGTAKEVSVRYQVNKPLQQVYFRFMRITYGV